MSQSPNWYNHYLLLFTLYCCAVRFLTFLASITNMEMKRSVIFSHYIIPLVLLKVFLKFWFYKKILFFYFTIFLWKNATFLGVNLNRHWWKNGLYFIFVQLNMILVAKAYQTIKKILIMPECWIIMLLKRNMFFQQVNL